MGSIAARGATPVEGRAGCAGAKGMAGWTATYRETACLSSGARLPGETREPAPGFRADRRVPAGAAAGGRAMTTPVLKEALRLLGAGRSVIPIRPDGTKSPALKTWKPYQERLPT